MSEPQKLYCCPNCKSSRIQFQMWYRPNTGEVVGDTGGYSWCEACADAEGNGEFKYCDELPPEATLEGVAPEPTPIEICVSGGVVQEVTGVPAGTEVVIMDYDVPRDEHNAEQMEEDEEGVEYYRASWIAGEVTSWRAFEAPSKGGQ